LAAEPTCPISRPRCVIPRRVLALGAARLAGEARHAQALPPGIVLLRPIGVQRGAGLALREATVTWRLRCRSYGRRRIGW
jgi:hypothetical protein